MFYSSPVSERRSKNKIFDLPSLFYIKTTTICIKWHKFLSKTKGIRNMKIAIYAILIGLVVSVSLIWEVINAITA